MYISILFLVMGKNKILLLLKNLSEMKSLFHIKVFSKPKFNFLSLEYLIKDFSILQIIRWDFLEILSIKWSKTIMHYMFYKIY